MELSSNPITTRETPIAPKSSMSKGLVEHCVKFKNSALQGASHLQSRVPYVRRLPLPVLLIVTFLVFVNIVTWAICSLILVNHKSLFSTAALSYSLGLRHALDADHISAIDLMTRRLIATGQRPVTVGTFFSLGHSTIVIITSIVVAATATGVSKHFNKFGTVGGIIGSTISAAFLILLGLMNVYILYRLVFQLKKIVRLPPDRAAAEAWKIEGGGILFRVLKTIFRLVDRPWKMYPVGVVFGLGFDTSSEIALLGISSIQGANGTSLWYILIFPVLFTAGMCLLDTIDGALMFTLYTAPMRVSGMSDDKDNANSTQSNSELPASELVSDSLDQNQLTSELNGRGKDPLIFLYYSIILTALTVIVALVIGTIQLLSMIQNVVEPKGVFWDGVAAAGDNYDIIGGSICGSFIVVGCVSVICYKPWRRWIDRRIVYHQRQLGISEEGAHVEDEQRQSLMVEDSEMIGECQAAVTDVVERAK